MTTATYAGVGDVKKRVPYYTIDTTTSPSNDDLQSWLDDGQEELDAYLQAASLPAPYTGSAQKIILRRVLVDYVEGRVRSAFASAGGDGGNDDGQSFLDGWIKTLESISDNPTHWGEVLGAGTAPAASRRVRGYVIDNSDDKSIGAGDFDAEWDTDEAL